MALELHCPNGCAEQRFEMIGGSVIVDSDGRCVEHRARRASFACATCGSVAVDLDAAKREMRADDREPLRTLTCPSCGIRMLPPADDPLAQLVECPACETRFGIEEGMPRLHGEPGPEDEDEY